MKLLYFSAFIFLTQVILPAKAWDNDDLEIFDLVELVNQNFYEMMGLKQDASLSEIKRAFRNLSIIMHPDKNDAPDANEKFRNLVAVYEVLKDSTKREKYDNVLKNGMPNWRSAVYYYRKARKMGLAEGAILLFVITTICQYFVSWGVYLEKKYTMASIFESKAKKVRKANVNIDSILNEIPKPSIKNTLPFQIPIGIYRMIMGTPSAIKESVNFMSEELKKELEKKRLEKEEEELLKKLEAEKQREKAERKEGLRKRKEEAAKLMEKTDEELARYSATIITRKPGYEEIKKIPLSGGLWTDEDLSELARLTKKYPGGTQDRWEIIAETMNRNVSEVTFMAYKLKDNAYTAPGETDKLVQNINKELSKKTKTKASVEQSSEKNWTQEQQKALEAAIQKYPKKGNEDRWAKIANSVPGKTKEECQARYKYLVDLLKKQKEAKEREEKAVQEEEEVVENVIDEPEEEVIEQKQTGGKKKNKRKEKKKNIDYYADSYSDEDDVSE
ncbi:hypothetical protein PVAND_011971 [Polypedilum vanderplanki]|uniref:Uncharacterized protein n=1 Tax=Polypedilum vanderplanki TaxID=319348 RepID=A0A9J6CL02_POLVA|nr:hypothetical protein PVAND_011971 [Polypedilum vanderplanki]